MFLALGPEWPITEKKQKRSVRPTNNIKIKCDH